MKRKTVWRLSILAAGLLLVVALGVGLYVRSVFKKNAETAALRKEGLAAFHDGDYQVALSKIGKYVEDPTRRDAETLFAYGKSRAKVPEITRKHIYEGVYVLKEYLNLSPPDTDEARILEARHILLELYPGYNVEGGASEGLRLADGMLAKDPQDVVALKARAVLLTLSGKLEEALEASIRYTEVTPGDLLAQQQTLDLMYRAKQPPEAILARAANLRLKFPEDPRFVALDAMAHLINNDLEAGKALIREAAKTPVPDAEFVRMLSLLMENPRIGMYDESRTLLDRAARETNDPRVEEVLIQRIWQSGKYEDVIAKLKDLDPASRESTTALLAYKAMSLPQMERADEALPIIDALAERREDDSAIAWATALRARFAGEKYNPLQAIRAYKEAIVRDPTNAVIRFMQGEAYARLGETELALGSWRTVAEQATSWSLPVVLISQSLANAGRPQDAYLMAHQAWQRSRDITSAGNLASMWYRSMAETGDWAKKPKLLEFVEAIQRTYPLELQSLPIYITLLAESERVFTAKAEIKKSIDPKRRVPLDLLLRLVSVSRSQALEMEAEIFARAEEMYGGSPQLALARAYDLRSSGKLREGLDHLIAERAKAKASVDWDLGVAQYREVIGDDEALKTWTEVGDAYPDSLAVQTSVLESRTTWSDRKFMARTLDRVYALAGEEGVTWKLARARFLLSGKPSERDRAEAINKLNEVVRAAPNLVRPRLLLAQALRAVNNAAGALQQLRLAAEQNPQNVDVAIEYALALNGEGRSDDARAALDRAVGVAVMSNDQRTRLASVLTQIGDTRRALEVLAKAPAGDNVARRGIEAELYRRQGKIEDAEKLYLSLIDDPKLDPALAFAAADFFGAAGRMDDANRALERLRKMSLSAGQVEIVIAAFRERYGSLDAALAGYVAATKADPDDANTWVQLAGFHLRQNRPADAIATADDGLRHLAANSEIEAMRDNARLLEANLNRPGASALIEPLSRNPRNEAAAATLRLLDESRTKKLPTREFIDQLRPLADRHPTFLPLQTLTMQALLGINRQQDAADLAARTLSAVPNSGEAARQAVAVFLVSGRWDQMLSAARAWRERAPDQNVQADLAVATALIRLNRALDAIETLKPYIEDAKASPEKASPVISTYAQALLRARRIEDAVALLDPLAKQSSKWRAIWFSTGTTLVEAKAAAEWIERGAAYLSDTPEDQYLIGDAWYNFGNRFDDQSGFARARVVLEPLAARDGAKPEWVMMLASCADQTGDDAGAETLYRKALQLAPNLVTAQNNLAFLLVERGGDLAEAKDLATRAVTSNPNVPGFQETLARVLTKQNQYEEAMKHFRQALDLDPAYVDATLGLAEVLTTVDRRQEALLEIEKVDSLIRGGTNLTEAQKRALDAVRGQIVGVDR